MGTWGYGVRQDDVAMDVIGDLDDQLKEGKSIAAATKAVLEEFRDCLSDSDDGPVIWLALADAQWKYGAVDPAILVRVRKDFASGRGLGRWEESGVKAVAARRKVIEEFLRRVELPNPKPRKLPKVVVRKPKYAAGTCLAIRLSNRQFGAALVTAEDHSRLEYGKNLVGVLNYMSRKKPDLTDFRARKWLRHKWDNRRDVSWYDSVGYRSASARLEVVGVIPLRKSDPQDSDSYANWQFLGEEVVEQRKQTRKK